MPKPAVDAFFGRVAADRVLQAKLKKIHLGCLKKTAAAKAAAAGKVAKLAATAGCKFTARDLTIARAAKAGKAARADVQDVTGQWLVDCSGEAGYGYCPTQQWNCNGEVYY